MNLDFDETQLMLRNQARDFIAQKCPLALVKTLPSTPQGYSAEVWRGMGELGWMSIPFPEQYGGAGMGFFEVLVLLEEMGRGAVPSPFLSTMLCGMAINEAGTELQKKEWLPRITRGDLIFALALTEPSASLEPEDVTLKAVLRNGTYTLSGTKLFCADAHNAANLLVAARTSATAGADGITLFLTPAHSPTVVCKPQPAIGFDGQCQVDFHDLIVAEKDVLGTVNTGWQTIEKVLQWGALGKCAEMVGAAARSFELSLAYSAERIQYGKHIGSFQAQQHRVADMWISLEASRGYFYEAAWKATHGEDALYHASLAKAMVSDMAEDVTDKAVRLHGAIGVTWDYELSFYFRRVRAASLIFGDASYHRQKIAAILQS